MRTSRIILSSFLDGFTVAGVFTRLRRPGAATQVFADPQPEDSVSTPDWSPGGERTDIPRNQLDRAARGKIDKQDP